MYELHSPRRCYWCGICDSEHPHVVGCSDWENDKEEQHKVGGIHMGGG